MASTFPYSADYFKYFSASFEFEYLKDLKTSSKAY